MSGGSFNYVCFKLEDNPFEALNDLREMESYLRARNQQLAADEIQRYVLQIETAQHRLEVLGKYYLDLVYAVEWWASGDYNEDAVTAAYEKLLENK